MNVLWKARVGAKAASIAARKKFAKPVTLPDPRDIAKLSSYLKDEISGFVPDDSYQNHRRAIVLVETRLAILNKRRPGDLHNL